MAEAFGVGGVGLGDVVLAGTDANRAPFAPGHPAYGRALHEELVLLCQAGPTAVDALHAATSRTAEVFGLADRGVVAPGKRADLVLLGRDPSTDITATTDQRACWIGGVAVAGPVAGAD